MTSPDSNWLSRALGRNRRPAEDDLHHCFSCGKDFVNPVTWEPVSPESWWMQLRCGECEVYREVTVTNKVAQRFDVELDGRADLIHRALNSLVGGSLVLQLGPGHDGLRPGLPDAPPRERRV